METNDKNLEKEEDIKNYHNYDLNLNISLSYNDIYAFLNKVPDGREYLQEITNTKFPTALTKDYVINNIVKPLKEAGVEKEIKASLIDIMQSELNRNNKQQNEMKDLELELYGIDRNLPLTVDDVLIFLEKTPSISDRYDEVKSIEQLLNIDINEELTEKYIYENIVNPVNQMDKGKEFKEELIMIMKLSYAHEEGKEHFKNNFAEEYEEYLEVKPFEKEFSTREMICDVKEYINKSIHQKKFQIRR